MPLHRPRTVIRTHNVISRATHNTHHTLWTWSCWSFSTTRKHCLHPQGNNWWKTFHVALSVGRTLYFSSVSPPFLDLCLISLSLLFWCFYVHVFVAPAFTWTVLFFFRVFAGVWRRRRRRRFPGPTPPTCCSSPTQNSSLTGNFACVSWSCTSTPPVDAPLQPPASQHLGSIFSLPAGVHWTADNNHVFFFFVLKASQELAGLMHSIPRTFWLLYPQLLAVHTCALLCIATAVFWNTCFPSS